MKVMIGVKRVLDPQVKARVKADGSGMDLENAKMSVNPFCENAIEEAIRLKEAGLAEEIITVSVGGPKSQDSLRQSLAMGADRSIHITTDNEVEPLAVAKALKLMVEKENPGMVLVGKQAIDDDSNQTGQMLAGLLGWAQCTFTSDLKLDGDTATATREIDGGLETISFTLPAVITVDLRLNEPRYATLPNVMKAMKKPLEAIALADLDVDAASRLNTVKVAEPPARQAGVVVDSVADLIEKLRNEARVI